MDDVARGGYLARPAPSGLADVIDIILDKGLVVDAYFSATSHDGYSGTPYVPQLDWDLGTPLGPPKQRGNAWWREFADGWAAVNLNAGKRRRVSLTVLPGLRTVDGTPAPSKVTLLPHHGVLYRR